VRACRACALTEAAIASTGLELAANRLHWLSVGFVADRVADASARGLPYAAFRSVDPSTTSWQYVSIEPGDGVIPIANEVTRDLVSPNARA
jgi:hypothetical protein